jgi:hypothetical protein
MIMGRIKEVLLMEDCFDNIIPWTEEEEQMWEEYEASRYEEDFLEDLFTEDIEDDSEK